MPKDPSLDAAYALTSPDDNRALYADWANTYDSGFAADMDYQLPRHVAEVFLRSGGSEPVLDVGAGTGLVAQHIRVSGPVIIDALDISRSMLDVAARKGIYRDTIEADLTQPLLIKPSVYASIVSSGTFTHGHVGPDALDELLRIAMPGAQFVLSVNAQHWAARGFETKFAQLEPVISGFEIVTVPIYGPGAPEGHRDDVGHIAVFRKV